MSVDGQQPSAEAFSDHPWHHMVGDTGHEVVLYWGGGAGEVSQSGFAAGAAGFAFTGSAGGVGGEVFASADDSAAGDVHFAYRLGAGPG